MRYRLVGPPGYSLADLKTLQDWVLDRRFKRVPGVIDVTSFGGLTKSYNIVIDLPRMAAYGLTLPQVIQAVRAGNATVGAGTIRIGPQAAVVQGIGLIRSLDDIRGVVISAEGGNPVLLSDLATVEIGNTPRLGIAGHEQDDDVVLAIVLMRRGEQTLPTIRGGAGRGRPDQCRRRAAAGRQDPPALRSGGPGEDHHTGRWCTTSSRA